MSTSAPSRRGLLGSLAVLPLAALQLPALSSHNPDAELIRLCDRFVDLMKEAALLAEHDEWAPDEGKNHPHYQALCVQQSAAIRQLEDAEPPATMEGMRAVARAALTLIDRNHEGEIVSADISEDLMATLALGAAGDFVWPPLPGTHAGAADWFPPHVQTEREVQPEIDTEAGRAGVQRLAAASLGWLGDAWRNAKGIADRAGNVITFDDLRAAGLPIPADLVGEAVA